MRYRRRYKRCFELNYIMIVPSTLGRVDPTKYSLVYDGSGIYYATLTIYRNPDRVE